MHTSCRVAFQFVDQQLLLQKVASRLIKNDKAKHHLSEISFVDTACSTLTRMRFDLTIVTKGVLCFCFCSFVFFFFKKTTRRKTPLNRKSKKEKKRKEINRF